MAGKWLSKFQMDAQLNNGISIGKQEPSRTINKKVGLGTLLILEEQTIFKPTTQILDGGNSSDGVILLKLSITSKMTRSLMFEEVET
jgi:hypothetical protein